MDLYNNAQRLWTDAALLVGCKREIDLLPAPVESRKSIALWIFFFFGEEREREGEAEERRGWGQWAGTLGWYCFELEKRAEVQDILSIMMNHDLYY